jgi:hypothetical protein
MITLLLPFNRKARVWVNDLPRAVFEAKDSYEVVLPAKNHMFNSVQKACVEWLVPTGPRAIYGLLGAEYVPIQNGEIHIQINSSQGNEPSFSDSLAHPIDDVRVGLPSEYVPGIISGLSLAKQEIQELLSGKVIFQCAAHGQVGSSEMIFKYLSSIVIRILMSEDKNLSAEKLASLFPMDLDTGRL